MTVTAVRDGIGALVQARWVEAGSPTATWPLVFDDKDGDKPGHDRNGRPLPFGRLTVDFLTADTFSNLGPAGGKDLHDGQAVLQLFGPKGDGYELLDVAAQWHKRVFQRTQLAGVDVWFLAPTTPRAPNSSAHAGVNVVAPWRWLELIV